MSNATTAERIFSEAIEAFPYPLEPTSITQGDFEDTRSGEIEYSEEFTFEVGKLLNESLMAGGWIDYRQEGKDIYISALFGIARNGDWKSGSILGECEGLLGYYDIEKKEWDLSIDTY
jgi:hypothetical protein